MLLKGQNVSLKRTSGIRPALAVAVVEEMHIEGASRDRIEVRGISWQDRTTGTHRIIGPMANALGRAASVQATAETRSTALAVAARLPAARADAS